MGSVLTASLPVLNNTGAERDSESCMRTLVRKGCNLHRPTGALCDQLKRRLPRSPRLCLLGVNASIDLRGDLVWSTESPPSPATTYSVYQYQHVHASLSCFHCLREVPTTKSALQHHAHWCALHILYTRRISLYRSTYKVQQVCRKYHVAMYLLTERSWCKCFSTSSFDTSAPRP